MMKLAAMRFGTERPSTVYVPVLPMVVVIGAMMLRLEVDTDPENMLPGTQQDRLFHNAVEYRLSLHDASVIGTVNNDHRDGTC